MRTALFALDVTAGSVDEAVAAGADLLVVRRPPFQGDATSTARLMHRLGAGGVALYVQDPGEAEAGAGPADVLAGLLGLRAVRPLLPVAERVDLVVTSVPHAAADAVIDALAAAGAGRIGEYARCAWTAAGVGTFVPGGAARPAIGAAGRTETVPETRVEMMLPRARRAAVVAALAAAHPYEEPPYYLCELAARPGGGREDGGEDGRVGELPAATSLSAFAARAARLLGTGAAGVRAAGAPERPVRTVALGGLGDGDPLGERTPGADLLAAAARSGAQVFLAGRVPDRLAAEARRDRGPALVQVGTATAARPWLAEAAAGLERGLGGAVSARVCASVSDPWWPAG
ncbi:Nif3-like dinuclear metal center hexameric protein [Actinomadura sp. WMMB 499]|nr:Nif3-like dinuclear metal center hexameric protein [Actinomadura sp. WMMB 499]